VDDLLPLIVFIVSVLAGITIVFLERRARRDGASVAVRLIAISTVLLIPLPYLAFALTPGDPDVWDFYQSTWFIPMVVLGGLAIGAIFLAVASRPVSGNETTPDR